MMITHSVSHSLLGARAFRTHSRVAFRGSRAAFRGTSLRSCVQKKASILRYAASRLTGALRFARGLKKELRLAALRLIGAVRFARGFKKELRYAA